MSERRGREKERTRGEKEREYNIMPDNALHILVHLLVHVSLTDTIIQLNLYQLIIY